MAIARVWDWNPDKLASEFDVLDMLSVLWGPCPGTVVKDMLCDSYRWAWLYAVLAYRKGYGCVQNHCFILALLNYRYISLFLSAISVANEMFGFFSLCK